MSLNNEKNFKNKIYRRNFISFGVILITFIFLSIRIGYLQLSQGPSLAVSANNQYYYEECTDNLTFKLLDNKGENLFNSNTKYFVVIDPMTFYRLNDDNSFIQMRNVLYILRDYDKYYDISLLQSEMDKGNHSYEVDKETFDKVKALEDIKGIYAYEFYNYDKEKNWNIKNILSTPFKYSDNKVLKDKDTLETYIYEYVKDNIKEKVRFEKDVSENIVSEGTVANDENNNVVTTLNKRVQETVEQILKNELLKDYNQVGTVLMKSNSGEILAMAQKDDWESNPNIGVTSSDGYLLGSTFKTIVYEAALENKSIDENKIFEIKDRVFPKSIEKLNEYTIEQAYIASSNETFAKIGVDVGVDNIYNMAKSQGLFDKVLGLENESKGTIEGYGEKSNLSIVTLTSIGQTVRTTPLASLAIANTVVNKGTYVRPRILNSIVKNNGELVKSFDSEKNQVLNEYTSKVLKDRMVDVVNTELGTGNNAKIQGVEIGGKTGTTEYSDGNKELSDGWFIGFFDYKGEYYTMAVFIPQSGDVKGESRVACSVFKNIVEKIMEDDLLD